MPCSNVLHARDKRSFPDLKTKQGPISVLQLCVSSQEEWCEESLKAHTQLLMQTTAPPETIPAHLHLSAGRSRAHVHVYVLCHTLLFHSNVKESGETALHVPHSC